MSQRSAGAALLAGALAGCVATAPMTAVMLAMQRVLPAHERYRLPPIGVTKSVAARLGLGRHADGQHWSASSVASHFGYGSAAGALFAATKGAMPLPPLVHGVIYGLIIWAGSYLGWLPALGLHASATQQPAGRRLLMIVAHVVWGATLDALLRWSPLAAIDGSGAPA